MKINNGTEASHPKKVDGFQIDLQIIAMFRAFDGRQSVIDLWV